MSYIITEREYNATLELNEDYREHQFFNKIVQGLDVYVLKNNEDLLMLNMAADEEASEDSSEQSNKESAAIPVWCHEKYAQYYAEHATDETMGKGFEPKSVPLAVFLEKWIPQLKENGIELAIFPLSSDSNWNVLTAEEFLEKANQAAEK